MQFRYARHTNQLLAIQDFYTTILGLEVLGRFNNHEGYDGIFLGHAGQSWHIEFTTTAASILHNFDEDDILVFYLSSSQEIDLIQQRMEEAHIKSIIPKNPYWQQNGIMYVDPDGHRIVLTLKNIIIKGLDDLSVLAAQCGIKTWNELLLYIKKLPYGRNANRSDFSLVLQEGKGTCSSKHAFVKSIADNNDIPEIKLMLCIFRMNETNTPKIASILTSNDLHYIPEAHCFLQIGNEKIDLTTPLSAYATFQHDIIVSMPIEPDQVKTWKDIFHKAFIKQWMVENNINMSFERLWQIRESCIAAM